MEEFKTSNLLAVTSRMESIPQVIKEAFYLKIPVITTNDLLKKLKKEFF